MPRLRRDRGVAHRARAVDVRGLWTSASVIAGTIFQGTRTPVSVWFRAIWWVVSQKNGASALGLQRVLGLGSYRTAWTWLHKLRRAMVRPGRDRVSEEVEVDETLVGGLERAEAADTWGRRRWWSLRPRCGAGPSAASGCSGGRCLSRQPADVRAARGATWLGGDSPTGSRATAACPSAAIATTGECSLVVASRPRRSCLASTGLRRSSSAGSWVRIRAASVASISTITSTSSPFGSIDEPHAIAGSSSIGSWNRPWRWVPVPTRRWSRVSVVGRRNATTTGSRDLSKGNTNMPTSAALTVASCS